MLGFGKKKAKADKEASLKEEAPADKKKKGKGEGKKGKESPEAAPAQPDAKPKKKRFSLKKLLIILVILGILGGGGFAGYTFFFTPKDPTVREYRETALPHLTLPTEMVRFSFDHFPGLYDAFLVFEQEVSLFEAEIARIEAVAAKYPEQQKIADRQKKIWEKGKNTLLKEFAKLEKPVKETFVLFQVNPREGQTQVDAAKQDLASSANAALTAAQQLTADLKAAAPKAPEGLIQGTFHKLKKKFL